MTTTSQTPQSVMTGTSTRRLRAIAVGGAVLATGLVWLAAYVLDIDLRVDQRNGHPPMIVGLPLVIGFTLALALLGRGALAVLERYIRRARIIWTVIAIAVLMFVLCVDLRRRSDLRHRERAVSYAPGSGGRAHPDAATKRAKAPQRHYLKRNRSAAGGPFVLPEPDVLSPLTLVYMIMRKGA